MRTWSRPEGSRGEKARKQLSSCRSGSREKPMQRRDNLRALPNRSGDTLGRACAYVADGEDTGNTGFEWLTVSAGIFSRQNESFGIQCHAGLPEPAGVRLGSDEQEQVVDWPAHLLARGLAPADRLKLAVCAFQG